MNTVCINGVEIAYEIDGTLDPSRPWVVFIHSLASDLSQWDEQINALADEYRILRYDIRGHGGSSVPAGPYSLESLADELKLLLDELLIAQVHLVGLSLGGMIAQQFALRHPIRLRSLVLASTTSRASPDAVAVWQARLAEVERRGMDAVVESTLERWFTPAFRQREPGLCKWIGRQIQATSAAGYAACAHAVARVALSSRLGVITCPVLVIAASEDRSTPLAQAEEIVRAIPQSRLQVIRDAAHLCQVEQPAAFNAALERFLRENR